MGFRLPGVSESFVETESPVVPGSEGETELPVVPASERAALEVVVVLVPPVVLVSPPVLLLSLHAVVPISIDAISAPEMILFLSMVYPLFRVVLSYKQNI